MIKHRRPNEFGNDRPGCILSVAKWAAVAVISGLCLYLGLAQGNAATSSPRPATATTEYPGPFTTMRVPSACSTPQNNLRYYNDQAPAGTAFLRSGAHGHGGYLRCIYFYVDGPLTGTDHHYGKWLVFTASDGHGLGLLIPASGIEASYVNCALPGYRFPYPVGNGQPNDCGESWVVDEAHSYLYQDNTAGDLGNPMHPAMLP